MATSTISLSKVGSGTSNYNAYTSQLYCGNGYRCCWSYNFSNIPSNATINSVSVSATRASNLVTDNQTITWSLSSSKAWSYTAISSTNSSMRIDSNFTSTKKCSATLSAALGQKMLTQGSGYLHWSTSSSAQAIYTAVTLTVTYTVAATTYTVTYSPGSYSSGSTYTATKTQGTALTLRGSTYTRTGYTQQGWSTSTYGTSKSYNLSGSYTTDAAVTLYPYWVANTYSVSYRPGSYANETATYSATKTYGTALTLRGSTYTRNGYTQAGWSTTDGGSKVYELNGSYTTNSAATLYPYWESTTVAVTGVTVSPTSLNLIVGQTGTLTASVAPSNATNKNVTWSTTSSSVATVSNGTVTAVGPGTCTIKATSNYSSSYYGTCSVTVTAATETTQMTAKEYFSAGSSGVNAYTGYNAYINVGYGHDTGSYKGRLRLNLTGDYSGKNIVSMKLFLAHTSKGGTEFKNSVQGLAIAADNSGAYNESYDATMTGALDYVEGVVSVQHSSSSYWVSWDITALKDIIIANPTCYLKLWDLGTLAGDEHLPCQYHSPTSGSTNYHPYLLITYEEEQSFSVTTDSDYYEAKEGETITILATGSKAMRAISTPDNFPGQLDDIVTNATNKTTTTTYTLNNVPGLYFCSLRYWDADDNESTVNITVSVLPKGTLYYPQNGAYREFMAYYPIDGVWHRCYYYYGADGGWKENE